RAARRKQGHGVAAGRGTRSEIRDDRLRAADLRSPLIDRGDERRHERDAHAQPSDVRDGMRLRNSWRTRSCSNAPESALVDVRTPGLDTPRISMQKWRAWRTTIAPFGASRRLRQVTICSVMRSWICGRRA